MESNQMRAKRALAALRAADQQKTGRVAGGMGAVATDRLADLDACTLAYRTWSPRLVPGLLQTSSYTAGAIKSHTPSLDHAEIGTLVAHRRARSESFFARRNALTRSMAWFLIGQEAIQRPLMNAHSHADQLRQLLAIAQDYDNLIIQVVLTDLPIPVTAEPFTIFHLDPGPPVGHLESMIGGWYTVAAEDISRLRGAFSDMAGRALSPDDSHEFISEELSRCWEHTSVHTAEQVSSSPATPTRRTASTLPALPPAPSE